MLGDIFSLVLCDFHTVKWCKESIYMVHIKWTLWILIYVVCKKFVFCRKFILKALFRFNGTSKPSLTIALKILKTIKKPLIPMVGPSKNIQWWWSNVVKTIEKPLKSMVAWKKTLTKNLVIGFTLIVTKTLVILSNVFFCFCMEHEIKMYYY